MNQSVYVLLHTIHNRSDLILGFSTQKDQSCEVSDPSELALLAVQTESRCNHNAVEAPLMLSEFACQHPILVQGVQGLRQLLEPPLGMRHARGPSCDFDQGNDPKVQ